MDICQDLFASSGSICDSHAHYDDAAFDGIRDELLIGIREKGVGCIINNSVDLDNSAENCLSLSEKYDFCYSAVGFHPETVEENPEGFDEVKLYELLKRPKVVAVGEIGLDYHFSLEHREEQLKIFRRQCEIANETGFPVIVHDRDAHGDTIDILKSTRPKGTVHCFSGSVESAKELISLGMYIGIGGVVTFKNARKTVEVAAEIPLERLLLETDAPYLAPEPYRGRLCHSAYIFYTALRIAEIRGVSVNEILSVTYNNARELYDLK